jgi:threonine/homoserine/homoserine lactone efflux protein
VRTVIVTAFATGFGLGFLVAAQIGPISLLCVRAVLRGRLGVGLGISLGVAIVDSAYAGLTTPAAVTLVAAIGFGSFTWYALLSAAAAARRRVGPRAPRIADGLSGLGVIGFGGALGWRTLRHA